MITAHHTPAPRRRSRDYSRLNVLAVTTANKEELHFSGATKGQRIGALVKAVENKQVSVKSLRHLKLDAKGADLRSVNLRVLGGRILSQGNFAGANLSGQNLSGLNIPYFYMPHATANGIRFDGSTISHATMDGAQLNRASFAQATGFSISMNHITAQGANWEGVLRGAKAFNADMRYGFFSGQSDFDQSQMSGVNLNGARTMGGNPYFTRVQAPNAMLRGNFTGWIFGGANLTNADGTGSIFTNAKFAGAEVTGMQTAGAVLKGVDARDAIDMDLRREIEVPIPTYGHAKRRDAYNTLKTMAEAQAPTPVFEAEPEPFVPMARRSVKQARTMQLAA